MLLLKGMSSTSGHGFHNNEWIPLKGMASKKGNGFY